MNSMSKKYAILVCYFGFLIHTVAQTPESFPRATWSYGGIIRGDTTEQKIYLIFTGGDYHEGGRFIRKTLRKQQVKASFFFTGDFYRLPANRKLIKGLRRDGHYLGAHSDKHLLYCDWANRDSLLVTQAEFLSDLAQNYREMARFGIAKTDAPFFLPPYEWYNDSISRWTGEWGLTLINFTPGTGSNADYTTPDMGDRYAPTDKIYRRILDFETNTPNGLNGFFLLLHIGTHPDRTDKFYYRLEDLLVELKKRGYGFLPMG